MSHDDPLQQNIRRTAGLHALKKIGAIVAEENRNDAAKANRTTRQPNCMAAKPVSSAPPAVLASAIPSLAPRAPSAA